MLRRTALIIALLCVTLFQTVAGGAKQKSPVKVQEITAGVEPGFKDINLSVLNVKISGLSTTLTVAGLWKGKRAGVTIELKPSSKPGPKIPELNRTISMGFVHFKPTGPESKAFVRALAQYYGIKSLVGGMRPDVACTALFLEGDMGHLTTKPAKIKLFHDEEDKHKEYFELFLNTDLKHSRLELGEKDESYRGSIVKAFKALPKSH